MQGEALSFRTPVAVAGPVEAWMLGVEREMGHTLRAVAKQGVHDYPSRPRAAWLLASLGMVGLAGAAIWWTWETEDAFRRMGAGDSAALKVRRGSGFKPARWARSKHSSQCGLPCYRSNQLRCCPCRRAAQS
jgi:hypothetical protein